MPLNCLQVSTKAIPKMHEASAIAAPRHNYYLNTHLPILETKNGDAKESRYFVYDTKNFITCIEDNFLNKDDRNYLRIFFASVNGAINIIYGFSDNKNYENGKRNHVYFLIDEFRHNQITENEAKILVNSYRKNQRTILNYYLITKEGHTKSFGFSKESIAEFIEEIKAHNPQKIVGFLAAYSEKDSLEMFHNLAFVQFGMINMDANGKMIELHIENCDNYAQRQGANIAEKSVTFTFKADEESIGGQYNKSDMCPPLDPSNCRDDDDNPLP